MLTQDQINQGLAAGKHVVTYGAGFLTAFGIMSAATSADLATDVDHIANGLKEISIGLGPLIAAGMAWWAQNRSKLSAKVADVKAADPHELVQAVQTVSPVTLRDAVAAQPEVMAIKVDSPATAAASPSQKVTT